MNDFVNQLFQMASNGGNPIPIINQMASRDPRIAMASRILSNGGNLAEIGQNMCKSAGVTPEQILQNLRAFK